ncbi:hypothetical protein [Streptomyces griseorubiginosus]|uniref:hypothetical protein n=1 Tax=Streptomyces griseorubiginosus TaxID=67304 RepID=UPI001AD65816|nr:hypothetical protein [Streptomyces griseorubiginosus]MBO4253085.1 hypothetical protein [Streptomyces griseorubiginosus]
MAAGGARRAEVTFRTPGTGQVAKAMAAHGALMVGAARCSPPDKPSGRFRPRPLCRVPRLGPRAPRQCPELGVPVLPGVATATEVMSALRADLDRVKLFPAEPLGGRATLRPVDAEEHQRTISRLEQQTVDLKAALEEREAELGAAREANRQLTRALNQRE